MFRSRLARHGHIGEVIFDGERPIIRGSEAGVDFLQAVGVLYAGLGGVIVEGVAVGSARPRGLRPNDVRIQANPCPICCLAAVQVISSRIAFKHELSLFPVVAPYTFKVMVQNAPAARLAPLRLTKELPAVAVAVPPQVMERPLGVATIRPEGSVSLKATPVRVVTRLGL